MRVFFDTEFVNRNGRTFLISIGAVREDGAELYLENRDFDRDDLIDGWMRDHVMDKLSPADHAVPYAEIGPAFARFCLEHGPAELWAHYAAHDFVAACDLYGGMLLMPEGMPKFCMDTKVVSVMTGIALPSQSGTPNEHHALVDARWGKLALDALGVPFARFDPERDYELPSGGGPGMSFPA